MGFSFVSFLVGTDLTRIPTRVNIDRINKQIQRERRRVGKNQVEYEDDDLEAVLNSNDPIYPLPETSDDEDYGDSGSESEPSEFAFSDGGDDPARGERRARRRETRARRRERRNRARRRARGGAGESPEPMMDQNVYSDDSANGQQLYRRNVAKRSYREVESGSDDEDSDAFDMDEGPSDRPRKPRSYKRKEKKEDQKDSGTEGLAATKSKFKKTRRGEELVFEPEAYFPTEWISELHPMDTPYRPQAGDMVAYLQSGHRAWVNAVRDGIKDDKGNVEVPPERSDLVQRVSRDLPWERKTASYPPVLFGMIRRVEYHVGPPAVCRLELNIYENLAARDGTGAPSPVNSDWTVGLLPPGLESLIPTTSSLRFTYFDKDGSADFLVLFDRYFQSMSVPYEMDDVVLVQYGDGEHDGTLTAKYASDGTLLAGEAPVLGRDRKGKGKPATAFGSSAAVPSSSAAPALPPPPDPWSCFRVRFSDGSTEAFSPWEFRRPDMELVPAPKIDEVDLPGILNALLRFGEEGDHALFVDAVDREQYPEYYQTIAYPMHLSMIIERLNNGFYRQTEALAWDIDRIRMNAMAYNDPASVIFRIASTDLRNLAEQIRKGDLPTERMAPRVTSLRMRGPTSSGPPAQASASTSSAGPSEAARPKRGLTLTMRNPLGSASVGPSSAGPSSIKPAVKVEPPSVFARPPGERATRNSQAAAEALPESVELPAELLGIRSHLRHQETQQPATAPTTIAPPAASGPVAAVAPTRSRRILINAEDTSAGPPAGRSSRRSAQSQASPSVEPEPSVNHAPTPVRRANGRVSSSPRSVKAAAAEPSPAPPKRPANGGAKTPSKRRKAKEDNDAESDAFEVGNGHDEDEDSASSSAGSSDEDSDAAPARKRKKKGGGGKAKSAGKKQKGKPARKKRRIIASEEDDEGEEDEAVETSEFDSDD